MLGCRYSLRNLISVSVLLHPNFEVENEETTRHQVPDRKRCWMIPTALFICASRLSIAFHLLFLFFPRESVGDFQYLSSALIYPFLYGFSRAFSNACGGTHQHV